MRIAYCLVGIVGACEWGKGIGRDIDYRLAHYWNKKNIFDINDVDVFMHSWSMEHREGLEKLYKPKASIYQEQIDFGMETIKENSTISRWYSTAMCNRLRQDYEKTHGFKYDAVMFFRYDHIFMVPVDFSKFDMERIWFRYRRPVGWVDGIRQGDNVGIVDTTKDIDLSTWEKRREFNLYPNDRVFDSFIFSKGEYIDVYAETYNELDTNSIISPHHEICLQLQRHNIWDKVDWHFFGEIETEALRALYKDPHLREGDFDINNYERFEEKYVRQNEEVMKRFKGTPDANLELAGFKTRKLI